MKSRSDRRGMANTAVGLVILALIATVGGVMFVRTGDGSERGTTVAAADTFSARTGTFDITVPATGELVASSQVEIASQLERRATITSIVAEGTFVNKGDTLITLDDEEISNQIREEEVRVDDAEAALQSAKSSLEVRRLTGDSQMSLAAVDISLAETALESWREGEDISRQQQLSLDLEAAQKDFNRLEERFEFSKGLLEKEFISEDEFSREEIEVLRASNRLAQAKLAKETYEKYDRAMQLERLQADIQRAQDKATETKERLDREIETQQREVQNKTFQLERRREELAKAKRQLAMCTIIAPQDGLVVYAATLNSNWRDREDPPEIGTELRRNRPVIILPDTSRMAAAVKVNEALAGRIRPGQRVVVTADALPNTPIEGVVESVGVLAEGGGWRDPNRRDYTVRVSLEADPELGLKPSMRCKSRIEIGAVKDAIHVPIQAVSREGRMAFVWVPTASGVEARPVRLGRASELMIEIRDGIAEGDSVLLRDPRPEEIAVTIDDAIAAMEDEGGGPAAGRRPA